MVQQKKKMRILLIWFLFLTIVLSACKSKNGMPSADIPAKQKTTTENGFFSSKPTGQKSNSQKDSFRSKKQKTKNSKQKDEFQSSSRRKKNKSADAFASKTETKNYGDKAIGK